MSELINENSLSAFNYLDDFSNHQYDTQIKQRVHLPMKLCDQDLSSVARFPANKFARTQADY